MGYWLTLPPTPNGLYAETSMKVARIEIEHFRSIEKLSYEPKGLTLLIGQNNAGKSNILRALNLVLGDSWPSERNFDDTDFYKKDTSNPIVIKVFFDAVSEEWRNNSKCEVAGFALRCRAYKRKTGNKLPGDLAVDYVCINKKGEDVNYPAEPLQKGSQYKGQWLPFRVSSELRERVPFIYIDVQREYRRHSPENRWTILRRLLTNVQTKLAKDPATIDDVDHDGKPTKSSRLQAYKRRLDHAFDALRSTDFETVETTLEKHALELLGLDKDKDEVRLAFDPLDPESVFRSLQLFVQEGGMESSAEEVGSGLQSAIVVAIFRTYQELHRKGAIFAIEEPEVFLHPHRARFFASTLCSLADEGNQVFLSTHSPLFVPMDRYEDIALVRKGTAGTRVSQTGQLVVQPDSKEYLRLINECDSQRSEMFFATRVILVEGYTERVAFPLVFKAKGIDANRQGISVVECQGKMKIPLFVKILASLGIPFVVVHDDDTVVVDPAWPKERQDNAHKHNSEHGQWNKAISDAINDAARLFVLKPNFEGVCGLPKREDTKLQQAIAKFTGIAYASVPAPLTKAIEALLALPV